jgi:hypothetical protein
MATVPAVALKAAELLLAGTVTDVGTLRDALLLESATALPLVGAAWLRVTVHVLDAPELTLAGLQARVETIAGAIRLRLTL